MSTFTTNAAVTDLLNAAQVAAAKLHAGEPATPHALAQLAATIKGNILTQVALGMWREAASVVDPDDFLALRVSAALGRAFGDPPIKVTYDFTKTSRPMIVAETVRGTVTV